MSVRNMLKVMMSLLLAVTLAATTAHAARLDQSLASVAAAGKLKDRIPYLLCQRICIGVCVCDRRPIEFAECICSKPGDSTESNKPAALLRASEEALQVKAKSEATVKSEVYPYAECAEKCDGICVCAAIWPPPATCLCAATIIQSTSTVEKTLQVKGKLENSGLIPYTECMKTCSKCACTRKWPPESNMCFCLEDDSVPKKAATVADRLDESLASVTEKAHEFYEKLAVLVGPVPKRTSGDDKKMVLWTTSKMEAIPYKECINTCEKCACTLIWPPEASTCICITPETQATGGKAVAK